MVKKVRPLESESAALKEVIKEAAEVLESLQDEFSIDNAATHKRYNRIKAIIDSAKKLLNKQPQSESAKTE